MADLKNEIGKKYGKLLVLEKVQKEGNTHAFFKCKCDCGNETIVAGTDLRSGKTTSCGCARKEKKYKFNLDLINSKFGDLIILKPDEYRNSQYYWICKCSCGSETSISETNLKKGKTTKCLNCTRKENAKKRALDLVPIGSRFGRLVVIEKVDSYNNKTNAFFKCKCDCGNETIVESAFLRNGHTKSCGCYRKEKLTDTSIIGQKFGILTVLSIDHIESKKNGSKKYVRCKCDCGNEKVIRYDSLIDTRIEKRVISCGCLSESYGEKRIKEYLESKNIYFKAQQTFKDLWVVNEKSLLKYDFAIKSSNGKKIYFLIEYDGIQHYKQIDFFQTPLTTVQEYDALKTKYANNNNIPLLRIPYTQINNTETLLENYIKTNFSFLLPNSCNNE